MGLRQKEYDTIGSEASIADLTSPDRPYGTQHFFCSFELRFRAPAEGEPENGGGELGGLETGIRPQLIGGRPQPLLYISIYQDILPERLLIGFYIEGIIDQLIPRGKERCSETDSGSGSKTGFALQPSSARLEQLCELATTAGLLQSTATRTEETDYLVMTIDGYY